MIFEEQCKSSDLNARGRLGTSIGGALQAIYKKMSDGGDPDAMVLNNMCNALEYLISPALVLNNYGSLHPGYAIDKIDRGIKIIEQIKSYFEEKLEKTERHE